MGYLVHADKRFTSFPVATGQRKIVRYIGRTYNAKTPDRNWTILSEVTKPDRRTFGKDGTFLRLWHKEEETPYGIHSHISIEEMLEGEDRYRSMGCILVSEEMLKIIQATYQLNEERLDVRTVYGMESSVVAVLNEK